MILSNLKSVATLQYKPEGPHMLFYMTTTKANLVWEQEHMHMQDKHKEQVSWIIWP